MSKNVYQIGSGELTFEIIERIINENLKLELAPEAKLRIQKCRDYLDHKIASSEEPLYGITTGFGSLCTKNISSGELGTLQENLIKSHACSVGEEIRPVIIKLMMLLKAHALSLGHSGVQLITVQRILDFFNNDVLPIVYDRGSLGASGDLAPLANLFLPLIGVGDVNYKGKKCGSNQRARRIWLGTRPAHEQGRACTAQRYPVHECQRCICHSQSLPPFQESRPDSCSFS